MMNKPLFAAHVVVLVVGILSFLVTSLAALLYLIEHRELKTKKFGHYFQKLPSLDLLDRLAVRTLNIGFVFLTLGMITGIYLAHEVWKGDWVHNTKVLFSVVTWVWYLVLLFVRYTLGWRGGKFFALTSFGFLMLLTTFLGVFVFFPAGGM